VADSEDVGGALPHLYAVYLGGDPAPGRLGEDHEVVFVVSTDPRSARRAARAKWSGADPKPHIDMIQELDAVDGFEVTLALTGKRSAEPAVPGYEPAFDDDEPLSPPTTPF
jgi:hypothetical protein